MTACRRGIRADRVKGRLALKIRFLLSTRRERMAILAGYWIRRRTGYPLHALAEWKILFW